MQDAIQVVRFANFDNPEFFYWVGQDMVEGQTVHFTYLENTNTRLYERRMDKAIKQIKYDLDGKTDNFSKAKAIFDYVTSHFIYAHVYDKYRKASKDVHKLLEFTHRHGGPFCAYGFFVNEGAVCEGVSKSFKLLCDHFEIPCRMIPCFEKRDDGERGTPHALNIISLDGEDYFVDATFGQKFNPLPISLYEYFLTSSEHMNDHVVFNEELSLNESPQYIYNLLDTKFDSTLKLRHYLATVATKNKDGVIRALYTNDDVDDQQLEKMVLDTLNNHAPDGKTWRITVLNGHINGVLCDRFLSNRINEERRKRG